MCSDSFNKQNVADGGLLQTLMEARSSLVRYLMLRGASPEEAEDLIQEIYVKLSAGKIGPVAEPRAYLYRMATNEFLLSRRAAGRRLRREEDWVEAQSDENREVDARPSIEVELIARQQLTLLQGMLDALPERTRLIFWRFRIEGDPQRQIAADIGISLSAVEKHLTRAYETISASRLRLDGDRSDPRHLKGRRDRHDI